MKKKPKPKISQADLDTFHDAVKGTKRIRHNNKVPIASAKATARVSRSIEGARELGKARSGSTWMCIPEIERDTRAVAFEETILPLVNAESVLNYHHPSISHKTLRNLRKGQYNVEAVLDLHGMTVNEAKMATEKFLRQCISDGARVVLVIHGKGRGKQPILKNKLNQWLRGITIVLAFCSASATHGSRGAVYVLLKRIQGEK